MIQLLEWQLTPSDMHTLPWTWWSDSHWTCPCLSSLQVQEIQSICRHFSGLRKTSRPLFLHLSAHYAFGPVQAVPQKQRTLPPLCKQFLIWDRHTTPTYVLWLSQWIELSRRVFTKYSKQWQNDMTEELEKYELSSLYSWHMLSTYVFRQ